VYRRRYGTDMPEASVPSRFLDEVPVQLVEEMGGSRKRASSAGVSRTGTSGSSFRSPPQRSESTHYSYEDEDQSASWSPERVKAKTAAPVRNYNSIDNIAEFFASRGKKFKLRMVPVDEPSGKR